MILWLGPKYPFPPRDGATKASVQLLEGLNSLGCEDIRLLSLNGDGQAQAPLCSSHQIFSIPSQGEWKRQVPFRIFSHEALTCARFKSKALRALLKGVLPKADYILLDGLHPAINLQFPLPKNVRLIYRAHNCETQIWQERTKLETSSLKRRIFQSQTKKIKALEEQVVSNSDLVAAVSEEDLASLNRLTRLSTGIVTPIGATFVERTLESEIDSRLLFVGGASWPPNSDGLDFLVRCFQSPRFSSYELLVAGRGWSEHLANQQLPSNVRVLDFVEDLTALYQDCSRVLVPIAYGSGTRVKAIEAISMGACVLSTQKGVEGLGLKSGEHYLEFDWTEESLLQALETSDEPGVARALGRAAGEKLSISHSSVGAAEGLFEYFLSGREGENGEFLS